MLLVILFRLDENPGWCVRDSAAWTDSLTVRASAQGRWTAILARLAPVLEPALARLGRHVPCPVHGGKDGFRLFADAPATGGGICNSCGAFPDGFALLMWLHDWRFPEALRAVASALHLTDPGPWTAITARSKASRTASNAWRAQSIRSTWDAGLDPNDPRAAPLRRYLARRGLADVRLDPEALRFHPSLPYWENGRRTRRYPALLARVTSPTGELLTLHRTYLTEDGEKAPVAAPRKLMPYPEGRRLGGGAIRLAAVGRTLDLAEGIETALAVMAMTGRPAWAATSAVMLERFEPPEGISELIIRADRDRSGRGEQAARALADRLQGRDLTVRIRVPALAIPVGAKGVDWLDLHQRRTALQV
jgi:phage/plasmid primase-like uncharacterized protein